MTPKRGQHLLVSPDATCDQCHKPARGRLVYCGRNRIVCRRCYTGPAAETPTPDTTPALACPACGGTDGEEGICVACARGGVFMTLREVVA